MKKNFIISALAAVAAANPEGYTVNAATLQPVKSGYAVALEITQNSFGPEGREKVVDVIDEIRAKNPLEFAGCTLAFGGWYDKESGLYYYDATVIVDDQKKALELGRRNKQIAIFDLYNMSEIRL